MKKILAFVLTSFVATFMAMNLVCAQTTVGADLDSNKVDVKGGQQVEVTFKLDDYNDVEKGINAYKATLVYDTKIFEQVLQDSFECLNGWEGLLYNPDNKQFVSIKKEGSIKEEATVKIRLKVKENVKAAKTNIKVNDIVVSEGKKDIDVKDETIVLNIIEEQTTIPTVNDANKDNNSNKGNSSNKGNKYNTSKKSSNNYASKAFKMTTALEPISRGYSALDAEIKAFDGTKSVQEQEKIIPDKKVDKTTDKADKKEDSKKDKENSSNFWLFLLFIGILILLLILFIYKKRKYERNRYMNFYGNRRRFMIFFITLILSFGVIGTTCKALYDFSQKGELNDDNVVDYFDVSLLESHLISLNMLPEEKYENADINSDGNITVTDLTLLVKKLENTLDYEVSLTDTEHDNYYPNKNEEFELTFDGAVSYGSYIEKVTINGNEYKAIKKDDTSNEYSVKVKAPKNAGVYEYKFTEAILNNGKKVKVDYGIKVDVLKDKPSIDNYVVKEDISDANDLKLNISFDLNDNDSSMTSGTITIKNDKSEVVKTGKITNGKNKLSVPVQEEEHYKVYIDVKYNLDSNELDNDKDHKATLSIEKDLALVFDYDFSVSDINAYRDNDVSNSFEKLEKFNIGFESSNASDYEPTTIKVGGKVYNVSKKDDLYVATIDGISDLGDNTITIEEVTLSNGKKFTLKKDNEIEINVIKRKPSVSGFVVTESVADANLSVNFDLNDEDKAVKKAEIIIYDDEGTEISSENLSADEIDNGKISKTLATSITSKYDVKVVVTYNQDNKDIETTLFEQEVTALPNAKITSVVADKNYVLKDDVVNLTYTIDSNKDDVVTKIRVNNVDCIAERLENGKYKVVYQDGNKAGIVDLVTSKLIYSDDTASDVKATTKIEILKDKPKVEDYIQEDNLNKSEVILKFNVADLEDSFISGNATLINEEDNTTITQNIKKGQNELTFKVDASKIYDLNINVTYDRDTNSLEGTDENDNRVTNETIFTQKVELIADYKLKINNIKTYSGNSESKYFEKEGPIGLTFESINVTDFEPIKAIINGNEYDLTVTDGVYETQIPGYETAGVKELKIEGVILDNTHHITLDDADKIKIEILKEKPSIDNFSYDETEDGKIKVMYEVTDNDKAIISGKIVIKDEYNSEIVSKEIEALENSLTFNSGANDIYNVTISADYDLDTNDLDSDSNEYSEVLLEEEISSLSNVIELKDVISTELYDSDNNRVSVLDVTDGIPTNLEDYYVKVNMKNLPTYYASVKSINLDGKKLNVTIDQTHFIMYKENGDEYTKVNNYTFQMPYTDEDGNHTLVKTANELFEQIGQNPSGNFILTEDLDASSVTSNPAIPCTFKGTLDGDGHKIINLSSALFNELNNATVKNLVIENARITNNSKGFLANNINNNSLVQNVHIKDSVLSNSQGTVGGFTGQITSSTIKESSAINVNLSASNTVGGIAGTIASGSIVENCYVTGSIKGTYNHNSLGARIGGIAGWHSGNKIDHCYTDVKLIAPRALGSGGLVGGPNGHPVIKNSVSLASGTGYRISGFNKLDNMTNVYEYAKSSCTTSIGENTTTVKSVTDIYDKNFYKNTLGFDENIWNLDNLEYNKLPNLIKDPMPNKIDKYEISENKNNIPNYGEIRNNSDYSADKEIAYYNLSKLMPFENTKNWVKMANSIGDDSLLNKSKIKFILPLDDEDNLIVSLGRHEASKIKKIRVIYTNDKAEDFNVSYKQTVEELVAIYKVDGFKFEYQFDKYLANISEDLLNDAVDLANGLDYSSNIASITSENESRLYVDFYNESVKGNIRDIISNYLVSEGIPTYSDNKVVKENLSSSLTSDKLIRLLYAYNYYEKWYRIDLDGVKVSDLMFFNGTKLNNTMTTTYMINSVVDTNTNNRATNGTVNFYNTFINGKVGKSLPDFLANLFKTVNGYDNPSDWMIDHFDGLIYEQPAVSPISDQITYRIWPIMTGSSGNMHMLLPILSAPQEDMYLISCPSQYIIGSLNRYSTYLNKDGGERDRMLSLMKNYGTNLGRFYGVSSSFIPNSAERINNIINVQFDTRFNFPASSKANGGTQAAGTTKDPVMKWVYEAVGNAWGAANGAGAYADGRNVWWIVDAALGYDRAVHVFTHETAHNQDNRYFYSGNGRRPNTGAEAHADGVISQQISAYTSVFNLTKNFALDSDYATNLSYERINSADKIYSYYKEMYETKYVLEYLAAQAFLRLTPEEQAKVAVQQQHNTGSANYTTNHVRLTADQIRAMNLKTVEDLWDNKLAIRGVGSSPHTWNGSYGHDSFFNFQFYIPNNPDGTPDTTTFKNTGYEMLGYAGYDKGFITYMSGRSANDLAAIRQITGDDTMTWKKYKMSRYENVRKNLSKVNYYDTDVLTDLYESAFKADAKSGNLNVSQAVTKLYYGIVKRATNDFSTDGIYTKDSLISVTSAKQFIDLLNSNTTGNYRIDADLDFSGITIPEGQDYYIGNKFIGTIDGNGHKFTGVKHTLFNSMAYAGIKNLTIERPTYADNTVASIAKAGKSFDFYNVKVNNSNLNVPHVVDKSGMYFSSNTNTITTRSTEISSADDLLAVGKSNAGLIKSYILTNDIDLSGISRTGKPIISGTFSGSIDGNGHKISNAKDVLFNSVTGTIRDIKIEGAEVTSNNAKGIFANSISGATIEDISINNSSIVNNTNGVGGLAGGITSSTINKISLTNVTVKSSNTVGGLAGQIGSGIVQNILVTGRVSGATNLAYNLGSRAGGITGWLNSGATIKYAVTNAEINGYGNKGNGGIIGGPNNGNSNIINSISLSTGPNAYRIAGFNTLNNVSNVYEFALSDSTTNINANNNTKVLLATEDNIKSADFYTNSVKLDSEIWSFADVSSGGVPKLKGVTVNNVRSKVALRLAPIQDNSKVISDDTSKADSKTVDDTKKENSETVDTDKKDSETSAETGKETNTESTNENIVKEEITEEVIENENITQETTETKVIEGEIKEASNDGNISKIPVENGVSATEVNVPDTLENTSILQIISGIIITILGGFILFIAFVKKGYIKCSRFNLGQ